jgi:hypothetical protein
VRTVVRPKASTARPNAASKVVSRSWRRNRAFGRSGKASRSCCRVQADVGCCVTLTCRMRRRSWARRPKTNRIRQVSVGTAKKSMATVEPTMVLEERPPSLRGWRPPARHQPGDRPLRDLESQLQQLSVNTRRTPKRVRSGHLSGQATHVGVDLRTAAPRARPLGPVPREAAAMPGDDRGRSDDHQG